MRYDTKAAVYICPSDAQEHQENMEGGAEKGKRGEICSSTGFLTNYIIRLF